MTPAPLTARSLACVRVPVALSILAVLTSACSPKADTGPGHDAAPDTATDSAARPNDSADTTDSTPGADEDGDGHASLATGGDDCDDTNPAVSPEATEACNGVDDDCDGAVDDGLATVTYYTDADGDGYGGDAGGVDACAVPAGSAPVAGDCDDGDPAVNPGAPEACNGLDDDCDGDRDEGLSTQDYYADGDGDGYGEDDSEWAGCAPRDGDVVSGGDCDDTDPAVNPSAEEICNDVDDDCDGGIDVAVGSTWYIDLDGDGYGTADSAIVNCVAPADGVSVGGDCDDADAGVNPGAEESCDDGVDQDCDGGDNSPSLTCALQYSGTSTYRYTASALSAAGDVNADGYDDILIGEGCDRWTGAGGAFLVLGSADPSSSSLSAADAIYSGVGATDQAGRVVSNLGDVNADGYDDVIVGAMYANAAYVVLGSAAPTSASLALSDVTYEGVSAADYAGESVSGAGDVNADGYDDILIGAPDQGRSAGSAYLLLGGASLASANLSGADATYAGDAVSDGAGRSVAGAGDVNADGYDDMLVGAHGNDDGGIDAGAAYIVLGGGSPGSISLSAADVEYTGESTSDYAGWAAAAGDVDADGYADVLVGAYGNNAAYLVLGGATPTSSSLSAADAEYAGTSAGDYAGGSVAGAGDVDADGFDDMLIGAVDNSDGGGGAGAAYLIFGNAAPASASLAAADEEYVGEDAGDGAGYSVGAAGDVDADGYADFLVGAPYNGDGGSSAGTAYLMLR